MGVERVVLGVGGNLGLGCRVVGKCMASQR